MNKQSLVLASSSPFRKELLSRLQLEFQTFSPEVDETPLLNEPPEQLAVRLAELKAGALVQRFPRHLIIGSDQVAWLDDQQLGKPGNRDRTIRQLMAMAGRSIVFYTSVCVLDSASGDSKVELDISKVYFRDLNQSQIEAYVDKDQPYNCAGGFKSESLGIALCERFESEDPNAIIGLPLIRLTQLLNCFGCQII